MGRLRTSARTSARVAGTVLAEVAALVALVAAGHRPELVVPFDHLGPWLRDGDPATVVVALVRWAGLLGGAWLLASTLAYLVASLAGIPRAMRALSWTTLPAVRRTIDAACAASIATSITASVLLVPTAAGAAGAARADDPPSVSVVRDGRGIARLPPDTVPTPAPEPSTPPAAPLPRLAPIEVPDGAPALPVEIVVAPGDNLWTLAAARLSTTTGRDERALADADVAPYWVRVCDANREHLVSGDPNLVYPGERIVFPPP